MKVFIGIKTDSGLTEFPSRHFWLTPDLRKMNITVPIHDDWGQFVSFDLELAGANVRQDAGLVEFRFPDQQTLLAFTSWLEEANAKADEGYRTMYP